MDKKYNNNNVKNLNKNQKNLNNLHFYNQKLDHLLHHNKYIFIILKDALHSNDNDEILDNEMSENLSE